jgi:AcrR family transcriptional regulator
MTPRRARLDHEQVVTAAEAIVDELGWDRLTMAALADRLDAKGPSLYNHVANLETLRSELQQRTMRLLGAELAAVAMGRAGRECLLAIAHAYREFVRRYRHRYEGATRTPIDRDAFFDAARPAADALHAIVRSYGVPEQHVLLAELAVFAALHGAVSLEVTGYYADAVDPDVLFDTMVVATERQLDAFAKERAA